MVSQLSEAGGVDATRGRSETERKVKRVLNVGSGPANAGRLHRGFESESWREIRLDIDPLVGPDLVGSITAMHDLVENASVDAIWCSHSLEHLYGHEVLPALQEFRRILKPDGFAMVTSPDLTAILDFALQTGLETVAYQSLAGPITAHDMLFGHGASIENGSVYMAHKTGFTIERLGRLATEAGFPEARIVSGGAFDLWALLMMPEADDGAVLADFEGTNIGQLFG